MLSRQDWAWISTLIIQGLNALALAVFVITGGSLWLGLSLLFSIVIIYYLLKPEVQEAFPQEEEGVLSWVTTNLGRLLLALFIPLLAFAVLLRAFIFLRDSAAPKWIIAIVAIFWGVGGVALLFVLANWLIEQLPARWKSRLTPFVFIGPGMAILAWYLFVPTLRTLWLSLFGPESKVFIWLENYVYAFTNEGMRISFRNNLLWLVLGTVGCVCLGLLIAVLADRTAPWFETLIKSLIFMPMAISLVGAGVIWLFVYAFRPAGASQIGLLNAIVTGLGGDPQAWTFIQPWNNFFLILIMIWMQTGFAMVILSAAIKGVPYDLLEAGRIDGANEIQIFFRIIIPYIRGTIVTVATSIALVTLKVFDIVRAMTGGRFGTDVIANQQYEMFRVQDYGKSSAIAIVLLLAVIPIIWFNLRQFAQQTEAFR
ncbi:MAG: sugar ABC transporter permease [Chloroflexia bacterium]|nr:sugar ABC transporter permease [Chloroflexia bacterium]